MKLVLIGPVYPYRGGIAHYTTLCYRALCARGHNVIMVSFRRQYPRWLFPGASDKDPSQKPLMVPAAKYWLDSLNPLTWFITFWRLYRHQPDAIILQWWTTFWVPVWFILGLLNRLFLRRPLLFICHNVLPHESSPLDPWLARWALRWGVRFCVQSSEEKVRLATLLPQALIEVVPHPVYEMFATQHIPKPEARRQINLPAQRPVILFFGIVRAYKGLKEALIALPDVEAELGKVTFLIAGEFWQDKAPYLALIEQLGIVGSVIIEDRYIPNELVPVYFSAADVLVAPYRHVTGSGAIQMAHGFNLPVVDGTWSDKQLPSLAAALIHCLQTCINQSSNVHPNNDNAQNSWRKLTAFIEGSVPERMEVTNYGI